MFTNLASVSLYCLILTNGLFKPYPLITSSCLARIICIVASCSCLPPVPNPTLTVMLYSVSHSLGFIGTKELLILIILSLSWYLQTNAIIPLNNVLTPVSANTRAMSSSLPCDADVIALTAVAVTFCRRLGSRPCCASDTPLRFA